MNDELERFRFLGLRLYEGTRKVGGGDKGGRVY